MLEHYLKEKLVLGNFIIKDVSTGKKYIFLCLGDQKYVFYNDSKLVYKYIKDFSLK